MKDGERFGKHGKLLVKEITDNRISISLMLNNGAPGYNSGSFIDTLSVDSNGLTKYISECDTSCVITFSFLKEAVLVRQVSERQYGACCFGLGVNVSGRFLKKSDEVPVIRDLTASDEITDY
ncbi:hypothetical protein FUAX_27450 [Fulvitalea axinellae]|uniref:Uncharacterized protein n=2 Tax=Fulvitalea axinellae TaxID=1182444 RepID=A0AAU9D2X7_9BACT|nr:hypothetical protein FUAX_27450 [Fulvitalea axinellae]